MQNLHHIFDNLRKQYQQDYGFAVFDVDYKDTKNGFVISGEVLTESQKNAIFELARKEKVKITNEKIKVLSDARKRFEVGWAVVKVKMADLKLRFVSNEILNEKILKRIRCSQAFQGEILRVLRKNEDQLLVQQNDLTLGWVNRNEVILKKNSLLKEWGRGKYAAKGKAIKITNKEIAQKFHSPNGTMEPSKKNRQQISQLQLEIIKEAEKYLGTKYLLGGKSKKGIDCSALTQVVYKNSLDVILPKHSWDQKETGVQVRLEDTETGDLVFLIKKSNQHRHVGIAQRFHSPACRTGWPNGTMEPTKYNTNLIHASLDQRKVVKQNLEKVFENYEFVEARRIVE